MGSPSLREIGNEQASEGTSIDGNRLSRMVRTLADRWNAVPSRNIKRRWVPVVYSGGFTPQESVDGAQDKLPWMGAYNSDKQHVGTAPDQPYVNPWRSKGNVVSGIDPSNEVTTSLDDLLTWTTSIYFRQPARLTGVFVGYIVDSRYHNTFDYAPGGGTPPPGKVAGNSADDWTVSIEVDDPYSKENRALSSILYKRQQNVASAWQWSNLSGVAPATDMQPPHPGGDLGGANSSDSLFLVDQNLTLNIPRDSRVRLHLTIPKYEIVGAKSDDYDSGWWNNGVLTYNPWQAQTYSWSLHFAEPLR